FFFGLGSETVNQLLRIRRRARNFHLFTRAAAIFDMSNKRREAGVVTHDFKGNSLWGFAIKLPKVIGQMKIQVVSLGCLELNHDKINRLVILSIGEIQPRLLGTKKHNYPLIARKIDLAETSDVLVINKCPFHGRSP